MSPATPSTRRPRRPRPRTRWGAPGHRGGEGGPHRRRRRRAPRRRRVPLLRLHPVEDGHPGGEPLAEARRVGTLAGSAEVSPDWGTVADAHPGRGDRRLGRPGRRRAPREGRRALRPRPRPARRAGRRRGGRHEARRVARGRAQHRHRARRPARRRARRHAVLDEPRHPARDRPAGVHGRHRRRRDRRRAGPGVRPVRDPGIVVEVAPRMLAPEEPEASEIVARALAADGIQVLAGASIRSVAHADGRFTRRPHRRRGTAARAGRRPPPRRGRAPPQPRRHRARDGRPRPVGALAGDRRADAGRRPALGDRRHHGQGRLHAHVDVPGRGGAARHPRRATGTRPSTTRCRA